jgi:hypothetical protein
MINVIRTHGSRHLVTVERDTNRVLGASRTMAWARAIGAAASGENGYRVVDLADVAGFDTAAAYAQDLDGCYVAGLALGRTCREMAAHYGVEISTVARAIRKIIGKLSRPLARRQVAVWILASATG